MTRLTPVAAALCLLAGAAWADTLSGVVSVVDGDTIEVHGQRIRIWGVDAPESYQLCRDEIGAQYRCGQQAALALADWIGRRPAACESRGKSWDRIVATCSVGGEDVGAWLVLHGHAADWRAYSKGAYADEQAEAEAADAGIWRGPFRLVKSKVAGE